jgi:ribosome-associated protein
MDIKKLQALVIDALEDVKAQDIKLFDTVHLTSLFDRLAVASGTSNRQTKALAASVRDKVKANGGEIVSIEGEDTGEWVLVDLGDMIVHIMQPAIRAYYRLEEIWGDKEVKFGAAKRTAKRSTTSDDAPKKTTRHVAASQADMDDEPKKPARKTTARKTADAAEKPARKTAAKKSTAAGKTAAKSTGQKIKVAAPKTAQAYKKSVAKKAAPAKKVAAKRAPAKKTRSAE